MKKTIFCLLAAAFGLTSVHAIGKSYDSDKYEALPVTINTDTYEFGISNYRNNSVVFLRTAASVRSLNDKDLNQSIVIYKADVAPDGTLVNMDVCSELMELGVSGTIAYDKAADKIYFTKYNATNGVYQIFESTYDGANEKWNAPKVVEIEGMTPSRKNMPTLENANWDYLTKGSSVLQPAIANNGTRLYFVSDMRGGEGKSDIWYVDFDGAKWSAPVNAGKGINTIENEQYPYVVGDVLYYSSNNDQSSGRYDLFAADTKNLSTEKEHLGTLFNTTTNDYNLIASGENMFFIRELDVTKDDIFYVKQKLIIIPPVTMQPEPMPLTADKEDVMIFQQAMVYFDFDKAVVKPEYTEQMAVVAQEMKQFPGQKFEIAGHTDEVGTDAYNNRLSQRRAETVRNMLVKNGIPAADLVVKAYGKTMPVVPNAQTPEDNAKNRRVEIKFLGNEEILF